MRRYRTQEMIHFLRSVDRKLSEPLSLLIIGGAAASLAYGVKRATMDIDTWDTGFRAIEPAIAAAQAETGLDIPFHHASVADAPYYFEDRLETVPDLDLVCLSLQVPERHDLVLMKTVRGYEHDLETAEAIHHGSTLSYELLLDRYQSEMGHVIGDPARLRMNFLALVDRLFGEPEADRTARLLGER